MATKTPAKRKTAKKRSTSLSDNGYLKVFAFGDRHAPHNDPDLDRIILDVIRDSKPDIIVDGGDAISADCLSTFPKNHMQLTGLQGELDEDYRWRTAINAISPNSRKILLKDNHFFARLDRRKKEQVWMEDLRYLQSKELMHLEELGWEATDSWVWENTVMFMHGDDSYSRQYASTKCPVNKVRGMVKDNALSIVRFHSHTSGIELHNQSGTVRYALQLGTLQDPDKAGYLKHAELANWTTSVAFFYLSKEKKHAIASPIFFFDKTCVAEGKLYS